MSDKIVQNGKIHPAVITMWAAVLAASYLVRTWQIQGTGSTFSAANILTPLSGILFGPVAGALCSAAGGFAGSLIAPDTAWMGLGTFIIGTCSSFTAGCIAWGSWPLISINRNGNFIINGGIIIYIFGTVLWFMALWFGGKIERSTVLFPIVCYGLGFSAMIAGSIISKKILAGKNPILKWLALWLCAFGGMIGGATIGNFFALVFFQHTGPYWAYLTVAAPIERAVFSAITALTAVSLMAGLEKIGIFAGPQNHEDKKTFTPENINENV
ncbi:MAG: hypothetical protein FWH41_10965 [Treponema sp.]|nr:hypothetical protein [Treponema sp.]